MLRSPLNIEFVFNSLLKDIKECNSYLLDELEVIESIDTLYLGFKEGLKISEIKSLLLKQNEYMSLLPTVFVVRNLECDLKPNLRNRFLLNTSKVNYSISAYQKIALRNLSCYNISFVFQMLLYIKECDSQIVYNLKKLKASKTALYLKEHIGEEYSQGQLIDYVDRIYDQYKHTNLPPTIFRLLFQCFGSYIEEIANTAFDYYIESRNTHEAWSCAVCNFLKEHIGLKSDTSLRITELIVNTSL